MSDPKDTKSEPTNMSQKDVEFLIACLQNANGGNVTIDSSGVATQLGYDNPRSVQNRISALKKKYNLPFGSSKGGNTPSGSAASPAKVTKAKAPRKKEPAAKKEPTTKKEPASKKKPAVKKEPATKKPAAKGKGKKKAVDEEETDAEAEAMADVDMDDNDEDDA